MISCGCTSRYKLLKKLVELGIGFCMLEALKNSTYAPTRSYHSLNNILNNSILSRESDKGSLHPHYYSLHSLMVFLISWKIDVPLNRFWICRTVYCMLMIQIFLAQTVSYSSANVTTCSITSTNTHFHWILGSQGTWLQMEMIPREWTWLWKIGYIGTALLWST